MKIIKYLDMMILLLSMMLFIFLPNLVSITFAILLLLAVRLYMSYRVHEGRIHMLLSFIPMIGSIFILITRSFPVMTIVAILTAACVVVLLLMDIRQYRSDSRNILQKCIAFVGYILLLCVVILMVGLSYNAINPDPVSRFTQDVISGKVVGKQETIENQDGTTYYKNLTYDKKKDNTVLDIYTAPEPKGTLFYIHGGGYAFDDKTYREEYLYAFVKKGYNVVNINYTLSPDVRYPETLIQANDALSYIFDHADEYGINPNKMIFSGDSAGSQLSGQLMLLLTQPDYAKKMSITPANAENGMEPKGFISVSGLLDTLGTGDTQFFATDWLFDTLVRSYFDTNDIAHNDQVLEGSILRNVDKQFPPTFMSDGNFGTFTKQAKAFHEKLNELGVPSELLLFDKSEQQLFHVFELDVENPYAQKVHQAQLEFMEDVLQ